MTANTKEDKVQKLSTIQWLKGKTHSPILQPYHISPLYSLGHPDEITKKKNVPILGWGCLPFTHLIGKWVLHM